MATETKDDILEETYELLGSLQDVILAECGVCDFCCEVLRLDPDIDEKVLGVRERIRSHWSQQLGPRKTQKEDACQRNALSQ